jgi:hypothetical protein
VSNIAKSSATILLLRIWKVSESHLTGILAFQMAFRYLPDALEKPGKKEIILNLRRKKVIFLNISSDGFFI